MADTPSSIAGDLRRSDPDRLVDTADRYVRSTYPGCRIDVLLADYRIAGLWPVLRADHDAAGPLSDSSAMATRAYASQRVMFEPTGDGPGSAVMFPMTTWHERIGVMVVETSGDLDADQIETLRVVADELALALVAADRSTDRYRRTRRRQRLTMAAEMQWEMLPGRALGGPAFALAGQLEPAYAVAGDHFDWSLNDKKLTITALNGDGNGMSATMLTLVAVNAMRNARRSGANLVEQAELASDAVYSLHGGKRHVSTLLLEIDLGTGEVELIDAGSPRMLRLRGTQVAPVDVDHQLPLGMFADTTYAIQKFALEPRDRLFVVSDGVHAAAPNHGAQYGERALATAVRATRLQPPAEAVGGVMRNLQDFHHGADLIDDAVIVCLDWFRWPDADGAPAVVR